MNQEAGQSAYASNFSNTWTMVLSIFLFLVISLSQIGRDSKKPNMYFSQRNSQVYPFLFLNF